MTGTTRFIFFFTVFRCLTGIAGVYWGRSEFKKAFDYQKRSYKIISEIGDKNRMAYAGSLIQQNKLCFYLVHLLKARQIFYLLLNNA